MSEENQFEIWIQKLDHSLEEIRARALDTIASKLRRDLVPQDIKWAVLTKLIRSSFLLDELSEQTFQCIVMILKSHGGKQLLSKQAKKEFLERLDEMYEVHPSQHSFIKEIKTLVSADRDTIVDNVEYRKSVESVMKEPSSEYSKDSWPTFRSASSATYEPEIAALQVCFPCIKLPMQAFASSDKHILESFYESLIHEDNPSIIVQSCTFFLDIMLQDFPAEVFLQRPAIVKVFIDLLKTSTSDYVNSCLLRCLIKLTIQLNIRIQQYNDPHLTSIKPKETTANNGTSSSKSMGSGHSIRLSDYYLYGRHVLDTRSGEDGEVSERGLQSVIHFPSESSSTQLGYKGSGVDAVTETEEAVVLQDEQLNVPEYCFMVLHQSISHGEMVLVLEGLRLLTLCTTPRMWCCADPRSSSILTAGKEMLQLLGDCLGFTSRNRFGSGLKRLQYLQLLAISRRILTSIVPVDQASWIIPKKLQKYLMKSLVDYAMQYFYPELHQDILIYCQVFPDQHEYYQTYVSLSEVYQSMTSAIKFSRNVKICTKKEFFEMARDCLPSLSYHRDMVFISTFVEKCVLNASGFKNDDYELWTVMVEVSLKLLAHSNQEIQFRTYSCYRHWVTTILGVDHVEHNDSSHFVTILNTNILTEIICFGVRSRCDMVAQCARDILVHLMKGHVIMPPTTWLQFLENIFPVMPQLQCLCDTKSELGNTIIGLLSPVKTSVTQFPLVEILKGNVRFLYSPVDEVREIAASNISLLLSLEKNASDKLPHISVKESVIFNHIFMLDPPVHISLSQDTSSYSQIFHLTQLMELLKPTSISPAVLKSTLSRMSTMMEDPTLHATFLEHDGLPIILDLLYRSVNVKEVLNSPEYSVPVVGILKWLTLESSYVRNILQQEADVYYTILRVLFLYGYNHKVRQDSSIILSLLIYNGLIVLKQKSSMGKRTTLSFPDIICREVKLPFVAASYGKVSEHNIFASEPVLLSKVNCHQALRVYWASEWYGGLSKFLHWKEIRQLPNCKVCENLKLRQDDLDCVKSSAVTYCLSQCIFNVQNATTHHLVEVSLKRMLGYSVLQLFAGGQVKMTFTHFFKKLHWVNTLRRFVSSCPASYEDEQLLIILTQFLSTCIRIFTSAGAESLPLEWVHSFWRYTTQPLLLMLNVQPGISKDVCREISSLCQELYYVEYLGEDIMENTSKTKSWFHIVKSISIKLQGKQCFYDVAFLEWMLSCLSYSLFCVTWKETSREKMNVLQCLLSYLLELVLAFHFDQDNSSLYMGVSISRGSLICMTRVVHILQKYSEDGIWELTWLAGLGCSDIPKGVDLSWMTALWLCRDTVVRTTILDLISKLCCTEMGSKILIQGLKGTTPSIWEVALGFLVDTYEACVVRLQAALILLNLCNNLLCTDSNVSLDLENQAQDKDVKMFLSLIEESNFYAEVTTMLSHLYMSPSTSPGRLSDMCTDDIPSTSETAHSDSTDPNGSLQKYSPVTPTLFKAVCWILRKLLKLDTNGTIRQFKNAGIISALFRSINGVPTEINCPPARSMYFDVVEMYSEICNILTVCVTEDHNCLEAIFSTNIVRQLLVLLDDACYYGNGSSSLALRNKLWSQVLPLLCVILSDRRGYSMIMMILKKYKAATFFNALKLSVEVESSDLCRSALRCFCLMLSEDMDKFHTENDLPSMSSLLDLVETDPVVRRTELPQFADLGKNLCSLLIKFFEYLNFVDPCSHTFKEFFEIKPTVTTALSSLLAISQEAKEFALEQGFVDVVIRKLKDLDVQLALYAVDHVPMYRDRKQLSPALHEINQLVKLISNFMYNEHAVKVAAVAAGLSDLILKLWSWICSSPVILKNTLKLICNYCSECQEASQSLAVTTSGMSRIPVSQTLLMKIIDLIKFEMELISHSRDPNILMFALHILRMSTHSCDCRLTILKSSLFEAFEKLHSCLRGKHKYDVFIIIQWLHFLSKYTVYTDGQRELAKVRDAVDTLVAFADGSKRNIRIAALSVLKNISFNGQNRMRLLNSDVFLALLNITLKEGLMTERVITSNILWALAANSEKAKHVLRQSGVTASFQIALNYVLQLSDCEENIPYKLSFHKTNTVLQSTSCVSQSVNEKRLVSS